VAEYSVEVIKHLEKVFKTCQLHRPIRIGRYDAGVKLVYDVNPVSGSNNKCLSRVHLFVMKFVGGGFAGQVYQVKVVKIENGPVDGLEQDGLYAMKILIPPSGFALLFRNLMYGLGFQGPFQLQVNPTAARSGAIWQKFIRRGAKVIFGDDRAVNDIHAIFNSSPSSVSEYSTLGGISRYTFLTINPSFSKIFK